MLFLSILIGRCFATLNLTIGIDINNKESLAYLGRLEQHYEQFEEKGLTLNIRNHILPCYTCKQRHNFTQPEIHCFGGGRYCQFSTYANGQQLLTEIIKQQCLFEKDIQTFLSYINFFQQDCFESPHYTFCSENILKNLLSQNTTQLDECVNASFLGEGDKALLENHLLAQEMNKQYNESSLSVYLDNKEIKDSTFPDMIGQICEKLKTDPPEYCNINNNHQQFIYIFSRLEKNTSLKLDDQIFFFVFIVLLMLLILIQSILLLQVNKFAESIAIIFVDYINKGLKKCQVCDIGKTINPCRRNNWNYFRGKCTMIL